MKTKKGTENEDENENEIEIKNEIGTESENEKENENDNGNEYDSENEHGTENKDEKQRRKHKRNRKRQVRTKTSKDRKTTRKIYWRDRTDNSDPPPPLSIRVGAPPAFTATIDRERPALTNALIVWQVYCVRFVLGACCKSEWHNIASHHHLICDIFPSTNDEQRSTINGVNHERSALNATRSTNQRSAISEL